MMTATAALSFDDLDMLIEGLAASASAHRGPKTGLALKKEAKRNILVEELKDLRNGMLAEMGIAIAPPEVKETKETKEAKPAKAPKGDKPGQQALPQ